MILVQYKLFFKDMEILQHGGFETQTSKRLYEKMLKECGIDFKILEEESWLN